MSRIGRMPIPLPNGVEVKIDGHQISVKGPKGTLTRAVHRDMIVNVNDNVLAVARPDDSRDHKALHGLTRALLANMVEGVSKGFTRELLISGVGYRAQKVGTKLVIQVGRTHNFEFEPTKDYTFEMEGTSKIRLLGIDKEKLGQIATEIRDSRKADPYKTKGIRLADEVVRKKAGKAGKAAAKRK